MLLAPLGLKGHSPCSLITPNGGSRMPLAGLVYFEKKIEPLSMFLDLSLLNIFCQACHVMFLKEQCPVPLAEYSKIFLHFPGVPHEWPSYQHPIIETIIFPLIFKAAYSIHWKPFTHERCRSETDHLKSQPENWESFKVSKNLGRLWLAYTELQGEFYMLQLISSDSRDRDTRQGSGLPVVPINDQLVNGHLLI